MQKKRPSSRRSSRGQAAVEYILVLALTAVFGTFVTRYFIDTCSEGMDLLSQNLGVRLETGKGFLDP